MRFSIGLRNANDKSMRLALTIGYRTLICDNMMFKGDFTPIFHKHTSRLDLTDLLSSWRNNPVILFVKGWNTIA